MSDNESISESNPTTCDEIDEAPELKELEDKIACILMKESGQNEQPQSDLPQATIFQIPVSCSPSLKDELVKIVRDLTEKEVLPDIVAELVERRKLNYMVLDLYDFDKGYAVSFHEYESQEEIFHGEYSYAVPLIEYIRDGQIPYEVFDKLYNYKFQIFYDGYVVCELRLKFGLEDYDRSHFVFLKQSIQTVDAECCMKCKGDKSLKYEEERTRLIKYISPDLCLDPDPVVAEIIFSYELNQHPFLTPYLKDIILNEKARREMGVASSLIENPVPQESASSNQAPEKQENWSFRLSDPKKEEAELAQTGLYLKYKDSLKSYLIERPICFPDEQSFTGFHVEIENFEYEYKKYTKKGEVKSVIDKLCIAVLDDKEYYYGAYQLNLKMTEKRREPCGWWDIGNRESLDIFVNAFTYEEMKLTRGEMKITHYRMFDEKTEYSDEKIKIIRQKLEAPVEQVVLDISPPSSENEMEEKMDQD